MQYSQDQLWDLFVAKADRALCPYALSACRWIISSTTAQIANGNTASRIEIDRVEIR